MAMSEEGLAFFGIFAGLGVLFFLMGLLMCVVGVTCFFAQKQVLFFAKMFGYKVLDGVFLGVEQMKNNFGQPITSYVVGYELNGVKNIVKLNKSTIFDGLFGGVKALAQNMTFPLLQNKKTGKISSGLVSDIYRYLGIFDGIIFLLVGGSFILPGIITGLLSILGVAI